MHCWPGPEHRAPRSAHSFWPVALALLVLVAPRSTPASENSSFDIRDVRTRLDRGVYLLDVDADVEFGNDTLEALQSGVPITVVFELEVMRERAVMDERIARVTARYQLEVHALSGQYVVNDLGTSSSRNFRTYPEAIIELGKLRDFPLFDAALLEDDERYLLRIRASLDIEALPSPMRLVAYFDSLWRLSSNWSSWELEP